MQYVITANYRNRSSSFPWLVREVGQSPSQAKAYKAVNAIGVTFRSADGMGESSLGCTSVAVAESVETFDPEIAESPALPVEAAPLAEEPARIPFDKARALAGGNVITRDGRKVTNIADDQSNDDYPINGSIEGVYESWTDDGVTYRGDQSNEDLFMADLDSGKMETVGVEAAPEPEKVRIHFNGSFYRHVPNGRGGERNEYLNGVQRLELKPDKTMLAILA